MGISVLITTLNEEASLAKCLQSIISHEVFDEVIVIDSNSTDKTARLAESYGVRVETFSWNGQYPKKRQWVLDTIKIKNDWVFWLDADEVVTPSFISELDQLDFGKAGYFVRGRYVIDAKPLLFGVLNNKLVLFNRHKVHFPVVDDLSVSEMGEMEGHYQPVLKHEYWEQKIGQIAEPILHYAYDDRESWVSRHERYAMWEVYMIQTRSYPEDPVPWRQKLKEIFRGIPCRAAFMFIYAYIIKLGVLDGRQGLFFSMSRYRYYRHVSEILKTNRAKGTYVAS